MAATTAELLITPDVSKTELDRSMKQIDKAIKKVAKNTEKEMGGAVKKGVIDGAKKGGGMGFVKGLGLAAVAAAIGGAIAQGFAIAAERVGGAEGLIGEMLGDKSAQGAISFARGQGMSQAQFQNLNTNVTRAGGDEQMTRDFVVDTSEYIAQAAAGENPLLKDFQGLKGTEQFNGVLASLAGKDPDEVNKFLADIGWAGDAGVIFSMLDTLDGKTGKAAFDQLQEVSKADEARAALITKEARLEKEYEDLQRVNNVAIKEDQINAMTPETLAALATAQKARAGDELKNILNYEENLKTAETARIAQQTLDDAMLAMANTVVNWFGAWGSNKENEHKRVNKVTAEQSTVIGGTGSQIGSNNGTEYKVDPATGRTIRQ
jgi:hypothetical protein